MQIFLWSDEVSRGFVEKTSAAIIVLLVFLLAMNGVAIYLRNKFERGAIMISRNDLRAYLSELRRSSFLRVLA